MTKFLTAIDALTVALWALKRAQPSPMSIHTPKDVKAAIATIEDMIEDYKSAML